VEKDRPAVVYCGVVMGITLITLDRPIRTGIIPLIGLSVYIPLILVFKTSSTLVVTDILDASIFTLAGIAISIFVGRIRIRDMVMRRTAEKAEQSPGASITAEAIS
jgi:Na+-transporting NADH:ubiquinone oxidoreductase subunit NqrD